MSSQIFKSTLLDETAEVVRHQSGLTVVLCRKPGAVNAFAGMTAKYGSVDTAFRTSPSGEWTNIVDGTAHFLEHKLFESEQGDAFELFAKTGANANAFTSFDKTCYYFTTAVNLLPSLRILLDFVTHPCFTEETVAKEQGIIGQEIKMYDDSPNWRVYFNMLNALYHNSPVKTDIAGTVETIAKITPALLRTIYNACYSLRNMVLAVAGDFDRDEVLACCDELLHTAPELALERATFTEPDTIVRDYAEQRLAVSVPLFTLAYKQPISTPERDAIDCAASEAVVELVAGESTDLYRELYDSGLINSRFGGEFESGRGFANAIFSGESPDPEAVAKKLRSAVSGLKNGVADADFARVKSRLCGYMLRRYNSGRSVGIAATEAIFCGLSPFDHAHAYFNLTKDDVMRSLEEGFNDGKCALSVVRGK